jgi:putative PIG3 family NAD(P)H quinone oxidoreductase
LPIPAGFSLLEAAGLPETFFTVWSNVFDRGQLSKGETLLVHGGASGIGTTAIQLAVALGHTVYATAGSDERVEAINRLGGIGINYKTEVYEDVIKSKTGGRGVDVILDMVSGDYINRDLTCLADDGRIVIIALLGGVKATINCGEILRRRLTITGSTLRSRSVEFKAQLAQALKARVWPLLEAGQVRPLIHATFPLEKANEAHAMMEAGEQVGKIILVP